MLSITVAQPRYNCGEDPDIKTADFLLRCIDSVSADELLVLPEYSNAGGLSDPEKILSTLGRADVLKDAASAAAKKNGAYISLNVIEKRDGKLKNSTYLYGKDGNAAFVYDKIHLPPAEVSLGIERGEGDCFTVLDGIRFGFMTCYDVYYSEQIEHLASKKPDIIIISGYQRGERRDIIRAQNKLAAFRCNSYIARASFSMDSDSRGGCSMIVAPDGNILRDMGSDVGTLSADVDEKEKYMRSAGFGQGLVRNDDFIASGLCPEIFKK